MFSSVGKTVETSVKKPEGLGTLFALPRPDGGKATFDASDPAGIMAQAKKRASVQGKPWLEERFAKLVEPRRAPLPAGCIVRSSAPAGCVCYTDEATIIPDVDQTFCFDFVAGKIYPEWARASGASPVGGIPIDGGPLKGAQGVASALGALAPGKSLAVAPTAPDSPPISIPPGAPVTSWRSSDWSVSPKYQ